MPRHQLGGTVAAPRRSPSRPAPHRTAPHAHAEAPARRTAAPRVTAPCPPAPRSPAPCSPGPVRPARRGAGAVGILTSALAGSGVVAGHVALGEDTTHVERLAVQALSTGDTPGARVDSPTLPLPVAANSGADGTGGAARAWAEPPPPVDVDAVTGAAASALDAAAQARRDAEEAGATGPAQCAAGTDGFGAVTDGTAEAGAMLRCMFGVDTVYGVAGRANASDHPRGKALDFMVDRAAGDRLAAYARANMDELGISYVIYRQRIDTGSGWEAQEDRGGVTANHMDHVHISFD